FFRVFLSHFNPAYIRWLFKGDVLVPVFYASKNLFSLFWLPIKIIFAFLILWAMPTRIKSYFSNEKNLLKLAIIIKKIILPLFLLYGVFSLVVIPADHVRYMLVYEKMSDLSKNPVLEIPHVMYLMYWGEKTPDEIYNLDIVRPKAPEHIFFDDYFPLIKASKKNLCQIYPVECEKERPNFDSEKIKKEALINLQQNNFTSYNVIFIIMESTRPDALSLYGGQTLITPNLESIKNQSIVFEDIYTTSALSARSMMGLLCSTFPFFRADIIPLDKPDVNLRCLSDILHKEGYKTAVFDAGSLDFTNEQEFFSYRNIDYMYTMKDVPSGNDYLKKPIGYEDLVVVPPSLAWIDQNKGMPFFITYFTTTTHIPYEVPKEFEIVKGDDLRSRYLNGIHYQDHFFGEIWRGLGARNLTRNTIIILTGDHSQAFHEHEKAGHGAYVYDEFVKVPLIIISPSHFSGRTEKNLIGQTVDVVPTVLDLLGLDVINPHQGSSLLSPDRDNHTIFFVSGEGLVTGLRDGRYKFIHNRYANTKELFDLGTDPLETKNLFHILPEKASYYDEMLVSFKESQNTLLHYDKIWYPRDEL
ncbi:MAG: sulfatase-like hydrolase/transferase, partial [Candidatus Altiarchaeota archaeon]